MSEITTKKVTKKNWVVWVEDLARPWATGLTEEDAEGYVLELIKAGISADAQPSYQKTKK